MELVRAADHADALSELFQVMESAKGFAELVQDIALPSPLEPHSDEAAYRAFQARARDLMASTENSADPRCALGRCERRQVWKCLTCGQVEAQQECVGVCIRRNEEFVRSDDYDAVVRRAEVEYRNSQELRKLVSRLSHVAPHRDRFSDTLKHFQSQARKVLKEVSARTLPLAGRR